MDPVREVSPGRWQWGRHGKIGTKEEAAAQARAAYANGYREDQRVRKAVKALRPPISAESRYVLDLAGIMGAVHDGIMRVVEKEHLAPPEIHQDAELANKPPLVRQATEYSCGAAAVLSVLRRFAPDRFAETTECDLYEPLGTTPEDGTEPQAMAHVLARELRLKARVRYPVEIADLERAVDQDEVAIVAVQAWREGKISYADDWDDGHYLVVAGYDAKAILFMDPATPGTYGFIPRAEFLARWHDVLRDGTKVPRLAIFVGPGLQEDAAPPKVGLTDRLLRKILRFQTPRVQTAFDVMADDVRSHGAEQAFLLGINPRAVAGLDSVIEHARKANVDLITNASADMLEKIRSTLEANEGQRPETIRDRLMDIGGISKRRGILIARDQVGKLNGQLVEHRARAAGLRKYRWSGALDERERPMHLDLEGQVFSWDDPPVTNENGDRNHPGSDFQCRCVGLPFLDDLDEAVGEGEEDPDVLAAEAELGTEGEEEGPPEEEEEPDEGEGDEEAGAEAEAEAEATPAAEDIDWDELEDLQRTISELAEEGTLTEERFEDLRARAEEAAAGDEEALAPIDLLRPTETDAADGSDDQPRDEQGRWTSGGAATAASPEGSQLAKTPSQRVWDLPATDPTAQTLGGEDKSWNGTEGEEQLRAEFDRRTAGVSEAVKDEVNHWTMGGGGWRDIRDFERDPTGFAAKHPMQMEAWQRSADFLSPEEKLSKSGAEHGAKKLQELFAKSLPSPGIVYRGLSADDAKLTKLLENDTLKMPATSSASRHADVAMDFGRKAAYDRQGTVPVVFRLKEKSGIAVEHLSRGHKEEREVLLKKGTTFNVIGRSQASGWLVVDAVEA